MDVRGTSVRVLTVLAGAMVLCASGRTQTTEGEMPNSLSEVAMTLLTNASVRIELKIDREQEAKAQLELVTRISRKVCKAVLDHFLLIPRGNGHGLRDSATEITRPDYMYSVNLVDLRKDQLHRLYELTYQRQLLSALVTPQAKSDLQITEEQNATLSRLWNQREHLIYEESAKVRSRAADQMTKYIDRYTEKLKGDSQFFMLNDPDANVAADPVGDVMNGARPILVKLMVDLSSIREKNNFDSKAFSVLSGAQKATLKKLRGTAFVWRSNL